MNIKHAFAALTALAPLSCAAATSNQGSPTYTAVHLLGPGSTGDASDFSVTSTAGQTQTLAAWAAEIASLQANGSSGSSGVPNLSIGAVTAVPYGIAPSASFNGSTLNLSLETGPQGATGATGGVGVDPVLWTPPRFRWRC